MVAIEIMKDRIVELEQLIKFVKSGQRKTWSTIQELEYLLLLNKFLSEELQDGKRIDGTAAGKFLCRVRSEVR
jgi:hypothetical protein